MNTLEKKLLAAIAAVVVLLIAAGFIAFNALNDSIEINGQVSNTYATLTEVESTLLTLRETESDQHNYIVAANKDALEHFQSTREDARRKLARLRTLTANNSRHQERLAKIEPAIHKRLDQIHQKDSNSEKEVLPIAKEAALSDEETKQTNSIGQLLRDLKDEEKEALGHRVALSERSVRNVALSFGSLFVLILALLFLVFFLVKRDLVTQKQLQDRLSELASVDELTTLYNRREINRFFKDEVEKFRRHKKPFSLLLLDIDHFKVVNDKYGHPVGDKVLQHVANKIRDGVRSIDVPGRFGGEEFAVILPNTDSQAAYVIAERLRKNIAGEPYRFEGADKQIHEVPITVSIGVSVIDTDETEEDVIKTADSALYLAKNEGRDRTLIYEQIGLVQ